MTPPRARFLLAALPLLLAACAGPSVPSTSDCSVDSQCKPGFICSAERVCTPVSPADAGHDAGTAAGTDAGTDGGADAGPLQGILTLRPQTAALTTTVGAGVTTPLTLGNSGTASLAYAVACAGATPTPASGAIAADDFATVAVAVPAPTSTGTKTITCTATTSDGAGGPLTFTLTLTVNPALQGHLTLSPATAATPAQTGQAGQSTFTLGNDGPGALAYAVACTGGTPTPSSGTLAAAGSGPISVAFPAYPNTGAQTVTCTATTSDGTGGPLTFTLTVNVGAAPLGNLTVAPVTVTGTGVIGTGGTTTFSVGNSGTASLDYAVACTGGTPAPASGTVAVGGAAQAVTVTYPAWTAAGSQKVTCTVTSTNGAAGSPLTFTATYNVVVGHLTVTPATRAVSALINATSSTTFTLGNDGTTGLHANVSCTSGAVATPTTASVAAGASSVVTVSLPSFAAAGTQTFVCTADPTDTPDASLTVTITLTVVTTATSTPVRLMAANLTSGNAQSYDPGEGIRLIQGVKPDVIMLQETNYKSNTAADYRSLTDQMCGTDCSFFVESGAQIPNAVMSRFPIITSGKWEDTASPNREFAWAKIQLPGHVLWAVSVHLLTSSSGTRNSQATQLVGYLQANVGTGDYVAVGGDFNTDSNSEACLSTFSAVVANPSPYPADQKGNVNTNSSRGKPYDKVLVDPALGSHRVATVVGASTYPNGLVLDTRVYTPLSEIAPALLGDSSASNMQHMGVVKDFLVPAQ